MNNTAVEVKNVSVVYDKKITALNNVSLTIPIGKITGFIGPSGAGKTTLIRSIVGRLKVTDGDIEVLKKPVGSKNLRKIVSYKTQEISVYKDLTIRENLKYFAKMVGVGRDEINQEIERLIKLVDLEPQTDQLVENLSGGQKQRVSLLVALIGRPQLMLLDEPTIGLDPLLRDQLWELFRKLSDDGATLIISSHVMEEAERCDDLVLIRNGQILSQGTPMDLRKKTNSNSVEESFLKLVKVKDES